MNFFPTRSAWLHLRIPFSFFLLPVFIFAVSQAPEIHPGKVILVFVVWHFFIYPASNGYNSYFDKDEGSIALIEKPPAVDKSLYYLSLILEIIGVAISLFIGLGFTAAVFIYGLLSKLYSHPDIRLKKYPVISFLIVFIFQGAFVYWATFLAISGAGIINYMDTRWVISGLICSCLIGASYPLTQVYQHEEDSKRGDSTLSILLGVQGSFIFSAVMFIAGTMLMFVYWFLSGKLLFFWIFLAFAAPVAGYFISWFIKVQADRRNANFRNMTRMTVISSTMILSYFIFIWMIR